MWEMAKNSIILFFQGKLFAEPGKVFVQVLLCALITAAILVGLSAFSGLGTIVSAGVAGLIGGLLQPYLFKDLKYR